MLGSSLTRPTLTPMPSPSGSHSYRASVKRISIAIKTLRGMARLVNTPSRPLVDKVKQALWDKRWSITPDKSTARFFASGITFEEPRRTRSPSDRIAEVAKAAASDNAMPKTSVAY